MGTQMYKQYSLNEANVRVDNILNMNLSNLDTVEILPTNEDLRTQTVRKAFASVICVKFKIKINDEIKRLKIQRLIASEFYNILNSHEGIYNISILNDTFIALYNTPRKGDIDNLIGIAAKLNSITQYFNFCVGTEAVDIKIAIHYSPISICRLGQTDDVNNGICYLGDSVSHTFKIVNDVFDNSNDVIFITDVIFKNLKNEYKVFFEKLDNDIYSTTISNNLISNWIDKTKK